METDKALLTEAEAAGERLARALNSKQVSDINDYMALDAAVLPPGHGTVRGQDAIKFWLNFAQRTDGVRMSPESVDDIGGGIVRDIGTLSLRPRGHGAAERITHRYIALWRRDDAGLTLVSLAWNRPSA